MAQPDDEDPLLKRRVWRLPHADDELAIGAEEPAATRLFESPRTELRLGHPEDDTLLFNSPRLPVPAAAVPQSESIVVDDSLGATSLFEAELGNQQDA